MTKLVNNTIAGAYLAAIAEGYAFAAKAGIDLQTTFEATREGFAGGPLYENKVPKTIHRDYEPGVRIAVHRKDVINAKHFAVPLRPEVPSPPGAKPIGDVKTIRPTTAEIDKGVPEVIEQWRDTFGN